VDTGGGWNMGLKDFIEVNENEDLLHAAQGGHSHVAITPIPTVVLEWSSSGDESTFHNEIVANPAFEEYKNEARDAKTNILSNRKNWFIKKLGVWKENDDESRASNDSEEIIFAEEIGSLGERWINISKSVHKERQ